MDSANIDDFALDGSSLAGPLEVKLNAVRAAGFAQITLCAHDLAQHPQGMDAAFAAVRASGLRVTGFQASIDFEGTTGPAHTYKLGVAKAMLGTCQALRCRLLVLPASATASESGDRQTQIRNMRQLSMLAIPLRIKVAYLPCQDAAVMQDYLQAWDLVCEADTSNLGLCLDTYDLLANGAEPDVLLQDLEMLDPDKIFLVRLADQLGAPTAPWRVFPGQGANSDALAGIVNGLHGLGYRGDYCVAAQNSDHAALPAAHVAQRAQRAALWVGEDVLQRSVPLPNQIRLRARASG